MGIVDILLVNCIPAGFTKEELLRAVWESAHLKTPSSLLPLKLGPK